METLKFKTNINCSGCIATVTPYLNTMAEVEKWSVDTASPQKILTIESKSSNAQSIIEAIKKAGYKADPL